MVLSNLFSPTLRQALRTHGFSKLACEVIHARGGFKPDSPTLADLSKSLCMKIAVDNVNNATVRDGLTAYRELKSNE